jgi:hypothetical protein
VLIRASSRLILAVITLAVAASSGSAQSGFRVSHTLARTTDTHAEITGTVHNEARGDALDVSVTVEALNAASKVVSRGIVFVSPRILEGGTAPFAARVPLMPGIATYRARVTSFRFIQSIQGP